ncbi:MAG: cbb3-type cytochrome oxidase assembly protein CcoS [Gemmatimonadales bacterium]
MQALIILVPVVLGLMVVFAVGFMIAAKHGQFDDLDDPPKRMLKDD